MNILRAFCAILLTLSVSAIPAAEKGVKRKWVEAKTAAAAETLLKRFQQDIMIENCEKRDICELKRVLFVADDYRVEMSPGDYRYFTLTYATYEAKTFGALEKYAFVQFIRGAVFTSKKNPITGEVEIIYNSALANFDQWLVYKIPSWIIDARDASPTYMSVEGAPRHFWYRWQSNILPPPWISGEEKIYGKSRPPVPRLYVDDNPQEAFVFDGTAYNVSLEFKTCLYKSDDIPATTTRDNVSFAEPLYCFPWRSSFVYNHDSKNFESPDGLVFPGIAGSNELIILGDKQKRQR